MQPWTGKRHIPVCLLIFLETELDPQGVGQVQTELRQLEQEAATLLGMSCSVHGSHSFRDECSVHGSHSFGGELLSSSLLLPWVWQEGAWFSS